jgi:chromosome segregation ATPase
MKVIACQSLLLLALLITSEALYIRKGIENSPLDALRKMGQDGAPFAANLISNIELHLTSGGKVDDVIELV